MRVLVWQWGRRGAGPRFATGLTGGFAALPGVEVRLSLSTGAEILRGSDAPRCDLPMPTYAGVGGLIGQALRAPMVIARLTAELRRLRPDFAVCALPGPLDLLMRAATRRADIPLAVIVHDAEAHPGDGFPLQFRLQRALVRRADLVVALSEHVVERLQAQQALRPGTPVVRGAHPPFDFGVSVPANAHDGPRRVLSFGRLLPYKGLDLLAEALHLLGMRADMQVRVVGQGPESEALAALRALPGVTVENRWVPEDEVGTLLTWADIVVLPYREASQSGVAAAALAAGRQVVATRVGGMAAQLEREPLAVLCDVDGAAVAAGIAAALRVPARTATTPPPADDGWRGLARVVLDGMSPDRCTAADIGRSAGAAPARRESPPAR